MQEIEINGKKYVPIKKEKKPKSNVKLGYLLAVYGGITLDFSNSYKNKKIDIVKEFELIQQKKSKLSRSQRDAVERDFNKKYKELKD